MQAKPSAEEKPAGFEQPPIPGLVATGILIGAHVDRAHATRLKGGDEYFEERGKKKRKKRGTETCPLHKRIQPNMSWTPPASMKRTGAGERRRTPIVGAILHGSKNVLVRPYLTVFLNFGKKKYLLHPRISNLDDRPSSPDLTKG